MSNEPTKGVGGDGTPDGKVADEASPVETGEIPVEVDTSDDPTRPVDVPDIGAVADIGAAGAGDGAAAADESGDEAVPAGAHLSAADWQEVVAEVETDKAKLQAQVGELEEKLAAVEAEKKEHYDRLLRSAADMENLRRRTKKDMDDARIDARTRVLKEMLPVIDNLHRAVEHSQKSGGDVTSVLDGIQLVLRQFTQALERCDVKKVEADGAPFDPNIHEAVSQAPTADVPPGTIVQVLQGGYKIGDRLLRPALVVVATAAPTAAPPADDDDGASGAGEAEAES